jgi:hypothetical protein
MVRALSSARDELDAGAVEWRVPERSRACRKISMWRQFARVNAVAGIGAEAWKYARYCLKAARLPGAEPWVLGSAHEALARAAAMLGDRAERDEHLLAARDIAQKLENRETREILMADIESVP